MPKESAKVARIHQNCSLLQAFVAVNVNSFAIIRWTSFIFCHSGLGWMRTIQWPRVTFFRFKLTCVQWIHFNTMHRAFGCGTWILRNEKGHSIVYNGWPVNELGGYIWARREDWKQVDAIKMKVIIWPVCWEKFRIWNGKCEMGMTVKNESEMKCCSLVMKMAVMFKSDIEKEPLVMRR